MLWPYDHTAKLKLNKVLSMYQVYCTYSIRH